MVIQVRKVYYQHGDGLYRSSILKQSVKIYLTSIIQVQSYNSPPIYCVFVVFLVIPLPGFV